MWFVADQTFYRAAPAADPVRRLRSLAALNRIHALSCIESARHGWLGASYSVAELLTSLYFGIGAEDVVLSKGHAAAMQYACLYGLGRIGRELLLSYKDGPRGLQAHTDRATPGILVSTGSLGQSLSKTAGLALDQRGRPFFVVLGDGELQEGQCWETFQTICHHDLRNVTVIVDRNGLQTAGPTSEVKALPDLAGALTGFGFAVTTVDGHDPAQLMTALQAGADRPRAVIADTVKAGGSRVLAAQAAADSWHGRVPDDELYLQVVEEQVALAALPGLEQAFAAWRRGAHPCSSPARQRSERPGRRPGSTGEGFARVLAGLAAQDERVVVLDADLAEPCGIAALSGPGSPIPGRFLELGIAEQDLVSCAGGLALAGRIPVVHTYASFFARACEQLRVNGLEGARAIYAGHYAGLSYFTDGKTHQSLSDLGMLRSIPGLVVCDPLDERQTAELLRWAVERAGNAVYFRLRRNGEGLEGEPELVAAHAAVQAAAGTSEHPGTGGDAGPTLPAALSRPLALGPTEAAHVFLTTGPQATRLALDARRAHPALAGWGILVQSVFGLPPDRAQWRSLLAGVERLVTVEDGNRTGGLWSWACELLAELHLPGRGRPELRSLSVEGFGPSFRSYEACCAFHGFTTERLAEVALASRQESA